MKNVTKIIVDLIRANLHAEATRKMRDETYRYRVVWLLVCVRARAHACGTRTCTVYAHPTCWVIKPKDMTRAFLTRRTQYYGSFFFYFSFFNATRVSLLSYVEACMYVCMYMYNWARTDPLCRNREVDTKHVANGLWWLRCITDTS